MRCIKYFVLTTLIAILFISPVYAKEFKQLNSSSASYDIQKLAYDLSEQNGRDYLFVLAIVEHESQGNPNRISKTHDYGLMQINRCNNRFLKQNLGITNTLDPLQNLTAGTYYIYDYINKYNSLSCALMAYNMGENKAKKLWKRGIYETKYSRKVLSIYTQYQEEYNNI